MINGNQYIQKVEEYFSYLISEFVFILDKEKVKGNAFYYVWYKNASMIISINYENIEDYFQVIIFLLENGKMPEYDDKTKTLHLNILNADIISKIDKNKIDQNNQYFSKFSPTERIEKMVLKSARELRLCLKYW